MSYVIVDVESDGPIPAEFSMVCFGAVVFDDRLGKTFYGRTRPISDRFVPEALAVSGFSREQHLGFDDPKAVMDALATWLEQHSNAGQSRSAAVVCKFLMKEDGNSLAEAMRRITAKRKVAIQFGLQEVLDF